VHTWLRSGAMGLIPFYFFFCSYYSARILFIKSSCVIPRKNLDLTEFLSFPRYKQTKTVRLHFRKRLLRLYLEQHASRGITTTYVPGDTFWLQLPQSLQTAGLKKARYHNFPVFFFSLLARQISLCRNIFPTA